MVPGDPETAAADVTAGAAPQQPAAPEHGAVPEHSAGHEHEHEHSAGYEHSAGHEHGAGQGHSADHERSAGHEERAGARNANGSGSGSVVVPLVESTQIRRAIAIAQKRTELNWSVFIGTLGSDARTQAEARHAELGPTAAKSVLIAVDPAAHRLEIITGAHARKLLDDRSCALAAAAMTSSFAVRDLDGGIAYGILAMVEHVRSAG
ncbi:MAG TPA: DUF5130 family protein [Actinocrinis sp.]|nr:DUF5130 family protein [Actinocrinis sp.]